MKNIGILYHPHKEAACILARELDEFLVSKGLSVWHCSAWEGEQARELVNGTDLIISIGGDGTILRAAQAVVPEKTPITGVNLGQLGFLTELAVEEAREKLLAMVGGEGWIDERSLLEAKLSSESKDADSVFYALNDVVVARGEVARVVYVEATINGERLTSYKADGVIVASATGSTGYSLSAGGPILHPHAGEMVLVPLLPHLSSTYSLVLPSESTVELRVSPPSPATLTIDGHINRPLSSEGVISIRQSAHKIRFLRIHPETSFYSTLEQKLLLKGKH